jgi:serine O-acetyltransferase
MMGKDFPEKSDCVSDPCLMTGYYEALPGVVKKLFDSCKRDNCIDNIDCTAIVPSNDSTVSIIHRVRRIIFPGYFRQDRLASVNLEHFLGMETTGLFDELSGQIVKAMQHDHLRSDRPCSRCLEQSHKAALKFIEELPGLRAVLATDVRAALDGDPAAKSYDEVISSYPGLFAITVYRIAHILYELEVPLLPRMMTEHAHSLTGIDIHPGAKIGESFFIDHGTGVVIGETVEIGKRVRLYQGVTLGALSLPRNEVGQYRNRKRHPTIGDDVVIYSNATLLGEKTVVGARSIIGGNVWITEPVPPDTKVILKPPELVYIGNHS